MKYLPSRELENATSALNFTTSDCRVTGSCDLYMTKAAGDDIKLYKDIEDSIQSQHRSLIRLSKSLSPPNAGMYNLNLERKTPFGSFDKVSSRRTFAYLIATLNASHPDYDFSHSLRPSDFRKASYRQAENAINSTLSNLRPRSFNAWTSYASSNLPQTPGGSTAWCPRTWDMLDHQMTFEGCEVFQWSPDDDPFEEEGEEGAIWSHHYFFFNKERRRVLYIHFRGLSPASPPIMSTPPQKTLKRPRPVSRSLSFGESGPGKRAKFWFGDKAVRCVSEPVWGEDAEEENCVIADPGDDEVDAYDAYDEDDEAGFPSDDEDDDEIEARFRERSAVRAMSQELAASMDL